MELNGREVSGAAWARAISIGMRGCQEKILPRGIITDAYAMRKVYLDEFKTPSACIAYGATIETSSEPDVVRQYGLEPGGYYLIASRLVPEKQRRSHCGRLQEGANQTSAGHRRRCELSQQLH